MSRGDRLSVLGLYHFNEHLFDEMKYPAGFSADDKQTVIGNILSECAELEILFPNYDTCKTMIGLWSKLNLPVWNRLYTASQLEYNPIENYNRTETETLTTDMQDQHSGNDISRQSGSNLQQMTASGSENNSGTDRNINSIASYDSSDLYEHDQSNFIHGHLISEESAGSNTTTFGKTDTYTHGEQITREGTITKENHTSGNIGVTTSQQMLEQEIEIAAKLNVMKIICDSFKERFCLLVY